MGWERRRGRQYFYAWVRVGGRSRKTYFGTGSAAVVASQRVLERKAERADQRQVFREERERHDRVASWIKEQSDLAEALCRAALILAGYYQHDRGEWRKARDA